MKILQMVILLVLAVPVTGCGTLHRSGSLAEQPGVGDGSGDMFTLSASPTSAASDARLRRQGLSAVRNTQGHIVGYQSYSYGRGHGFGTSYRD